MGHIHSWSEPRWPRGSDGARRPGNACACPKGPTDYKSAWREARQSRGRSSSRPHPYESRTGSLVASGGRPRAGQNESRGRRMGAPQLLKVHTRLRPQPRWAGRAAFPRLPSLPMERKVWELTDLGGPAARGGSPLSKTRRSRPVSPSTHLGRKGFRPGSPNRGRRRSWAAQPKGRGIRRIAGSRDRAPIRCERAAVWRRS